MNWIRVAGPLRITVAPVKATWVSPSTFTARKKQNKKQKLFPIIPTSSIACVSSSYQVCIWTQRSPNTPASGQSHPSRRKKNWASGW